MHAQPIKNQTRNLGKPADWDEQKLGPCGSLPIVDAILPGGARCMVSAWKPTESELALLNEGGLVYLTVVGTVHPPVAMQVEKEV